jgi:hypothetical protein
MDWPDYLRDQAAKYRQLAERTDDPVIGTFGLAVGPLGPFPLASPGSHVPYKSLVELRAI